MSADDVVAILRRLTDAGIPAWLTGGWGIDALLGRQTRPHKDLDVLVRLADVARLMDLLAEDGYALAELWSENAWVPDPSGDLAPTAFVLRDPHGRELDVHALRFDDQGHGIPAWNDDEGRLFTPARLSGTGRIGSLAVQCLSSEMQLLCHQGYALPEVQQTDLRRLRRRR